MAIPAATLPWPPDLKREESSTRLHRSRSLFAGIILALLAPLPACGHMTSGRHPPWIQDTPGANVWGAWKVTNRDVVMLDGENRVFRLYNLTEHDLGSAPNYAELRGMLLAAAGGTAAPAIRAKD